MEFKLLHDVRVHNFPPASPQHDLTIPVKVPALRFIERHEKQHELSRVCQFLIQGSFLTH